jgi:pimeloyl-ACP methyl ester carboxylesterase
MKRILMLAIATPLLAASALLAQTGMTGKWDVTASPEGRAPIKLSADLKHDGKDLSGTVDSPLGSGPVKNAVINGSNVAFQFLIGKYVFEVKAVSEGDEIKGTFNGPRNMKGPFLARRTGMPPAVAPVQGVEVGTLGKASYRIDIPANFNGQLVMYCHGYGGATKFDKETAPTPVMNAFLELGYAIAQSGYSAGGWAVKEAIEETEALRKYFASKYGKPKRTWVTGHSMGGTITMATIETYPDAYDGALQMCGPTGATLSMFQRYLFDMLVVYDYYFPGLLGSPAQPGDMVRADPEFLVQIQKEAQMYPDRLAEFQKWSGLRSEVEVSQVVSFFALIQKELIQRAGGNAFDNRSRIYQGTSDDVALNRGVKRYTADPQAVEYLKKYYTPTGDLKKPVLSLHTTYDPLIPAWAANAYGELAVLRGAADLYVQRFVAKSGHCAFSPQQTQKAFQDLVSWKETGQRPESGEQK